MILLALTQAVPVVPAQQVVQMGAADLMTLAGRAERSGDLATAERALRALVQDGDVQVRSEARYRLARLVMRRGDLTGAALLLRAVLDEQPQAQPVRLELARVLEAMGDDAGARRALREVQAGGLPPDVARVVDRYSQALRARKPLGASFEMAFAPDTNINRATRSETLGTVLGDFALDEDARERSGIGLALRGQAYARLAVVDRINLLGRLSGTADLYRDGSFNDLGLAVSGGPELASGADRIALELGSQWRWYGGDAYSQATTLGANLLHPIGRTAQIRLSATTAWIANRRNALQSGRHYAATIGYERALSARAGAGAALTVDRQSLRDPGYASTGGQLSLFAYREFGPLTAVATLSHGRTEADERLSLYASRRSDRTWRGSLSATVRTLRVGQFAPFVRVIAERNASTVEVYDYRRLRGELGVTRAF